MGKQLCSGERRNRSKALSDRLDDSFPRPQIFHQANEPLTAHHQPNGVRVLLGTTIEHPVIRRFAK